MLRVSPFRLLIVACVTALIAVRLVSWLLTDRVPSNLDSQPTGSASLSGRVVDGAGKPIAVANVRLASENPRVWRSTTTDAEGRFTIAKLPAADYQLVASKKDYLDPTGLTVLPRVVVADGQRATSPDLALILGGVISGTIYDDAGKPWSGKFVRALQAHDPATGILRDAIESRPLFAGSDENGRYAISGLPAGEFVIAATADASETRFYHPAATRRSDARVVTIQTGQTIGDIDIRASALTSTTITARVTSRGKPLAASVELWRIDDDRRPRYDTSNADGGVSFLGVTPDQYWVVAHTIIGDREHWGAMPIEIKNATPASVTIALAPDAILSGTVELESAGARPAPALTSVTVVLRPVDNRGLGIRTATVHGDGHFAIQLPPGQYSIFAHSRDWALTRARVNGRDALKSPLDVPTGASLTAALTLGPR